MMIPVHYVPNTLSLVRLILSPFLLVAAQSVNMFSALYLLLVVTDVLDGHIARRYTCCSILGSRLDSLADGVFFTTLMILLWPMIIAHTPSIVFVIAIILIRAGNLLLTRAKHHRFMVMHSIANKATGMVLVVGLPFIFLYPVHLWIRYLIFSVAIISSVEKCLLLFTKEVYNPNEKGFLFKS